MADRRTDQRREPNPWVVAEEKKTRKSKGFFSASNIPLVIVAIVLISVIVTTIGNQNSKAEGIRQEQTVQNGQTIPSEVRPATEIPEKAEPFTLFGSLGDADVTAQGTIKELEYAIENPQKLMDLELMSSEKENALINAFFAGDKKGMEMEAAWFVENAASSPEVEQRRVDTALNFDLSARKMLASPNLPANVDWVGNSINVIYDLGEPEEAAALFNDAKTAIRMYWEEQKRTAYSEPEPTEGASPKTSPNMAPTTVAFSNPDPNSYQEQNPSGKESPKPEVLPNPQGQAGNPNPVKPETIAQPALTSGNLMPPVVLGRSRGFVFSIIPILWNASDIYNLLNQRGTPDREFYILDTLDGRLPKPLSNLPIKPDFQFVFFGETEDTLYMDGIEKLTGLAHDRTYWQGVDRNGHYWFMGIYPIGVFQKGSYVNMTDIVQMIERVVN